MKTSTPGVYKRGKSYVVRYRDPAGRSRKAFARTLAEARDLKASLTADVKRGEWRVLSRVTFAEYAPEWIAGYAGRTSRGFREETRREYRRDLGLDDDGTPLLDGSGRQRGALAHFGRLRLAEVEPRDVKGYAVKLAEAGLSPASVRNALAPVRALFATAVEEGLIRSNPAAGLRIAQRVEEREDGERVKALTEEELRRLLDALPSEWRPFFALIAHTGVRISEAVGLRGGDVDFGRRYLHVRRRIYRGEVAPPKSRYGKRAIPLSQGMSQALWERRKALRPGDDEPLFASKAGTSLDPSNVFASIFKPAARRAGVGWAGFHTLRHTAATMLFRHGANAKQVQAWLGHHSPAFTLATYVHLLPGDLPDPDFFDGVTAESWSEAARSLASSPSASVAESGDRPSVTIRR